MTVKLASLAIGLSLCLAGNVVAQSEDEPVGWPYRPKSEEPKTPMPVPAEPAPAPSSASSSASASSSDPDMPSLSGTVGKTENDTNLYMNSGSRRRPDADIAPIERIHLPVRPLDFIYDDDRIALNRDEAQKLMRLAKRLRDNRDRLHITSYGPGSGSEQTQSPRDSLEVALTRALHIRSFLVHEGIALPRIDLEVRPHNHPDNNARTLYGHVHIKASSREKDIVAK